MSRTQFNTEVLALYDEMMAGLNEQFFFMNFFTNEFVSNSTLVDVEVMRDERAISVDVLRGSGESNVNITPSWTGKEYKVPLYDESTALGAEQLTKRIPGTDPYQPQDKRLIMAYWVAREQAQNTKRIMRAIEKQAAEALQLGTVTLSNTESIDFQKKSNHNLVPSVKWDQAATATPIDDIDLQATRVHRDGKTRPRVAIFGENAFNLFWKTAQVQNALDKRYIDFGRIGPQEERNGAVYKGQFTFGSYNLELWVSNEFYSDSGTPTPYMNTNSVIIMDPGARLTKGFGAVDVLDFAEQEYREYGLPAVPQLVERSFVPYVATAAPSTFRAGVQSAPIVIPTAIDTIATISGVNT